MMRRLSVALLSAVLVLFSFPCHAAEHLVSKVFDGDTILLESGETVRYIGIDTPELGKTPGTSDFYAKEAASYNKKLVLMKKVRLEFDAERRDQHGRLLAYVYVKDLFVNGELVRLGYARAMVRPPNVKHKDLFLKHQNEAMAKEAGLWQEKKQDTESSYIGNKRNYVFHRPSCKFGQKIPEKSRIIFRHRTDPIKIGYSPCRYCKP
jgi:micrococcal nuclease